MSEPCNLSVLAYKTTFHFLLLAHDEVAVGVTYKHLSTRQRVEEAHSVEPCIEYPRGRSTLANVGAGPKSF